MIDADRSGTRARALGRRRGRRGYRRGAVMVRTLFLCCRCHMGRGNLRDKGPEHLKVALCSRYVVACSRQLVEDVVQFIHV